MKKNNKLFAAAFAIVFGLTAAVPGVQAQAAYRTSNLDGMISDNYVGHIGV